MATQTLAKAAHAGISADKGNPAVPQTQEMIGREPACFMVVVLYVVELRVGQSA